MDEESTDTESEEYQGFEGEGLYLPYEPEDPEDVSAFISSVIDHVISKVIPEKRHPLTLEQAGKCLRVLGKVWNLSEYPPANVISEYLSSAFCDDDGKKLMDMEGYVDDYQYLHIEAVDMGLTSVKILPQHFIWLLSADLSGNRLNNVTGCTVTKLPNLVALRLNRNCVEDPYMPPMKHLQYLGLNSNKIQSMHRIYHPNLATLDLNFNRIKKVDAEDCWRHPKLQQLELRGNMLKSTSGIEYDSLVNLYLAQNQITHLKGLEILVNLERLHLRDNPLVELTGFSESNLKLKYLNVRKCQIPSVDEVKNLSVLKGLKELVVKGNPFDPEADKTAEKDENEEDEVDEEEEEEDNEVPDFRDAEEPEDEDDEEMRITILTYVPSLTRINKKQVTMEEKSQMRDILMEAED